MTVSEDSVDEINVPAILLIVNIEYDLGRTRRESLGYLHHAARGPNLT